MLLVLAEAFYKGRDRTALVGLAVAGSLAAAIASIVLYRQLGAERDHRSACLGDDAGRRPDRLRAVGAVLA